jgi:lipid-A-disaccharide synthase-like uncharacterized protein
MSKFWLILGFTAQAIFFGRWFVQWVASEKEKKSTVPTAFWYLSLIGGVLLLIYAIYKRDPVFIVGQGAGTIIYFRNIYLIHKHRNKVLNY